MNQISKKERMCRRVLGVTSLLFLLFAIWFLFSIQEGLFVAYGVLLFGGIAAIGAIFGSLFEPTRTEIYFDKGEICQFLRSPFASRIRSYPIRDFSKVMSEVSMYRGVINVSVALTGRHRTIILARCGGMIGRIEGDFPDHMDAKELRQRLAKRLNLQDIGPI